MTAALETLRGLAADVKAEVAKAILTAVNAPN